MDTYCLHVAALQIPIKLLILVLWYFRTEVLKKYDVNGKNDSGSLPNNSYEVLWKQQKTQTRAPVCEIQSNNAGLREQGKNRYNMSIAAFPTLTTVCHHAGFRAANLLFSADGRKWWLKDKWTEGTWATGQWFNKIQPSPLRFLQKRRSLCDHVNTVSTSPFVVFSVTTPRKGFFYCKRTFTPRRLIPPGVLQHKHPNAHSCIWSTIFASIQPSIIILDLFCSRKIVHKPDL